MCDADPLSAQVVVNHELCHGLHYGLWLSAGPLSERLSSSVNESVADILAHVFDGDPCHGKVLDEAGKAVGCRRNMAGYEKSVSDELWDWGCGDHETGQPLRDLVWQLRARVNADELHAAIIDGIAAVQPALNRIDREPLATAPVFDDSILAERFNFMREYDASDVFYRALCAGLGRADGVCGEHEARIGDPREGMRESSLLNAPTTIGAAGVTLADGRKVSFEVEGPYIPAMTITAVDGVATRRENQGSSTRTAGVTTLWFGELGDWLDVRRDAGEQ